MSLQDEKNHWYFNHITMSKTRLDRNREPVVQARL